MTSFSKTSLISHWC